jgi:hypothetical protein
MITCLICKKVLENKKEFGYHLKKHKMKPEEYKNKFNLHLHCKTCNCILPEYNVSGFCKEHRDTTGVNNPFFGKKHSNETKEDLKVKCRSASQKMWQDPTYREKVVKNATGKTRADEFKKEQSERITQWYVDNPQQLEIRSKALKNT